MIEGEEDLNLDRMKERLIRKALVITKGDKIKASKKLGMSLRQLYRKVEEYEIN